MSKQEYDIYNSFSEFYTDKCSSTNINGDDIVIQDRINDIYPNDVYFYVAGCELDMIKMESKRIKCNYSISHNEENVEISDNQTVLNASEENFIIY